jgi:metal-sulfur cluster biosynthetic enzyme
MDESVLAVLRGIDDPEIGVNLVDLGLVYEAERVASEVTVRFTTTSRSCPLGEFLREEAWSKLAQAFPEATRIDVELVRTPRWTPARMNAAARVQLKR